MHIADLFNEDPRVAAIDKLHEATAIYTREPVVEQMLDLLGWPAMGRRLLDTSCGDGAFLVAALRKLLALAPELTDAELRHQVAGWEIHPAAAEQCRRNVAQTLLEQGRPAATADQLARSMVRCGDFLTEGPHLPEADLIVGNPPYMRWLRVPEVLRGEYVQVVPQYAKSDLLHAFLERCSRVLRPAGVVGLVTKDCWLSAASAAPLRDAMGRRFRLASVRRLDASTAFYRPKQRRKDTPPRIHPCAVVLRSDEGAPITCAPIYPDITSLPCSKAPTLSEIAIVRLGPWLGPAGRFFLPAAEAGHLPPDLLVPVVDTADVFEGRLRAPTRVALRTSSDVRPPDAVLAHLDAAPGAGASRRGRCSWLPPESFASHDLGRPGFMVPRIVRSLAPVDVPAGVLVMNHNLCVVPREGVDLAEVRHALTSNAANEWLLAAAPRLENDYRAVSAPLLRRLPAW